MTTDSSSKIIPNSFQTPNFYVDECMPYLTGNEMKCLILFSRKTFGWQKYSDRISKSQMMTATGLGNETVDKVISSLVEFALVLRLAENNGRNNGVKWGLQTDSSLVRFDLMEQRLLNQANVNRKKTSIARQKRNLKGGGDVQQSPPQNASVEQKVVGGGDVQQTGGGDVGQLGGGDVQHPPQKPLLKATRKNGEAETTTKPLGANAPVRASELERIEQFPEDCREGVALMHEVFRLLPPEKPEPNEKGGEFALWIKGIRDLMRVAQEYQTPLKRAMQLAYLRWNQSPFTLSHPGALKKIMTSALAQQSLQQSAPEAGGEDEFSLSEQLKNFKPRKPD